MYQTYIITRLVIIHLHICVKIFILASSFIFILLQSCPPCIAALFEKRYGPKFASFLLDVIIIHCKNLDFLNFSCPQHQRDRIRSLIGGKNQSEYNLSLNGSYMSFWVIFISGHKRKSSCYCVQLTFPIHFYFMEKQLCKFH